MQILRVRNFCTSASHKCNFVLNQAKGRKSAVFFFPKKSFRQQTALAMPGHHALAQTAHSSHMLRPLTAPTSWHYRTTPCAYGLVAPPLPPNLVRCLWTACRRFLSCIGICCTCSTYPLGHLAMFWVHCGWLPSHMCTCRFEHNHQRIS